MICCQLFFVEISLLPKIKPVFQKLLLVLSHVFFICRQKLDLLQVSPYLAANHLITLWSEVSVARTASLSLSSWCAWVL